jgi:hypothetical protein
MRLVSFAGLLALTLLAIVTSGHSVIARHHEGLTNCESTKQTPEKEKPADPISGAWGASFYVQGATIPATFDLKLDGTKVTGTVNSDYTGPGTIRDGSWAEGKLSLTLHFEKRDTIAVNGTLKDGKLLGEFTAEGFTSNWEAVKK